MKLMKLFRTPLTGFDSSHSALLVHLHLVSAFALVLAGIPTSLKQEVRNESSNLSLQLSLTLSALYSP